MGWEDCVSIRSVEQLSFLLVVQFGANELVS